ncbi:cat eye syndrome critical region protein 2 [Trichonephila clavata]|uniref:Cat eye syndrome critical region protein 2 n=1 Tax=Trichonephila clavata TaxID=2740835 RepID=A0A8X6GQL2_TRICU|nr:cat eye syndrome critical region protein 2 [Trichonephila clavata]
MDELQSWFEVPAIAHFCYVFRAAFNLIYIEIGELEAAILNMQDPEMCISLEQLIMKLLQGCYDENEVTSVNWEEKLIELFDENCEDDENPLRDNVFAFLSPRSKVEVLFKLCEFRLDADGALEAIKDISPEVMQARCVGKDGQNNVYWYFCDERLYKEDLSIPVKNSRKPQQSTKGKSTKDVIKSVKRSAREKKAKSEDNNKSWSIVCHNTGDWEALIKTFSKSKHKLEKELAKEMKTKYLPVLAEVVSEKDRLLRKRFLELAPKRMSSRISKVQAQKKLEEQMVEEANEKRRLEMEEERVKKEAEKKKQEVEDRRKRAEARQKIIEERSKRAQQRDMMRGFDENDYNSDESDRRHSRSKKGSAHTENESDHSEDEEEEDSNESSNEDASQSESEQFDEGRTNKNETAGESEDESDDSSQRSSNSNVDHSPPVRPSVIQNACNISKWNADIDSKERKIHVLRYPYSVNKRLKTDGSSYTNGPVNISSPNDLQPNYYQESHRYHHSLLERTLNSCSKSASPPPIIRIGFIKSQKRHLMRGKSENFPTNSFYLKYA